MLLSSSSRGGFEEDSRRRDISLDMATAAVSERELLIQEEIFCRESFNLSLSSSLRGESGVMQNLYSNSMVREESFALGLSLESCSFSFSSSWESPVRWRLPSLNCSLRSLKEAARSPSSRGERQLVLAIPMKAERRGEIFA